MVMIFVMCLDLMLNKLYKKIMYQDYENNIISTKCDK